MKRHIITPCRALALLVVALGTALPASAVFVPVPVNTPGLTITSAGPTTATPQTLGYEFTLNSDILATDLGFFDAGQDGLGTSHQVGLWDATTQTLLASATVPAGTTALLQNYFRFVPITPVPLLSGTTYYVGGFAGPTESWSYGNTIATPPQVNYVRERYSTDESFTFPDATLNNLFGAGYFGGNFAFQSFSPVPEPSTALWAVGLLSFTGLSRWRRARA